MCLVLGGLAGNVVGAASTRPNLFPNRCSWAAVAWGGGYQPLAEQLAALSMATFLCPLLTWGLCIALT